MFTNKNCVGTLIFILLGTLGLTACDSDSETPVVEATDKIRPAKLFVVNTKNSSDFLSYPATIQSQRLSELSFEVSGVLQEVVVVEAQSVKEGDVLAKLDPRDFEIELKSAKAKYDNSRAEYNRYAELVKKGAISRSSMEEKKSGRDVNKALYDAAKKALEKTEILAPFDGVISTVSVKERQRLPAGDTAVTILGEGGLEAKFNLPSRILAIAGKTAEPSNDSYITLDSAADIKIPAVFKEASLQADENSQTHEVTFTFDTPQELVVLPGMNAIIWFKNPENTAESTQTVMIPLTSIVSLDDEKFVWIVDSKTMEVSQRKISVQKGIGEMLGVTSGLEAGDTIVAAGTSSLSDGMKVRPWSQ